MTTGGIKRLRRIQLFQEATATKGTADEATAILRALGTIENLGEPYFPDEDIGYLVDVNRACLPFQLAQLEIEDNPATFEQLPYYFSGGIKLLGTGVADGGGTGKIYSYPVSYVNPVNDFQTYTIEGGDNEEMEVMSYGIVQKITLSGKPKEPWMVSATVQGRNAARNKVAVAAAVFVTGGAGACLITSAANDLASFLIGMKIRIEGAAVAGDNGIKTVTASAAGSLTIAEVIPGEGAVAVTIQQDFSGAALPVVECINFSKTQLFIGEPAGAFGDGENANTILGFSCEINTGIQPMFAGSGYKYFPYAALVNPSITLDMTLIHNGEATDEKQLMQDGTARLVRIQALGTALTIAGVYTYKTVFLDIPGMWSKWNKIGEEEGNDIIECTLRAGYDSTAAKYATMTVVNQLATLP